MGIYLVQDGFFMLVHPTMYRNQWYFCLEVYRSTLIQHTYLAIT